MFSPASSSSMLASNPGDLDGSGTINPASLNPAGAFSSHLSSTPHLPFSPPATATSDYSSDLKQSGLVDAGPRGIKRSRSPDQNAHAYKDTPIAGEAATSEEPVRRKRGRPPKNKGVVPANSQTSTPATQRPQQGSQTTQPVGTPQLQHAAPPSQQPGIQSTPPKPVATRTTTVKALPTVRDHTTDQLNAEGDEYIIRDSDEAGDKKVMPTGHLLGGREYKCRTFHVPNRGDKLFMLATECARVLGYRDSYLLFNKNKSLHKIIATQAEKDDLIQQELLPYSYRSRQIAIVTAKSMFRQFGSRVIVNGRRVRDDYWEMKARKQGFTEDDPAGEKRPGAAKQRAAQQQANQQQQAAAQQQVQPQVQTQAQTGHHEPHYGHDSAQLEQQPQPQMVQPGLGGPAPVSLAPLPMIHVMPQEERTSKELYSVPRPRQEISGPPYQDRTSSAPMSQIMDQAQQTADFNKSLTQNRTIRKQMYNDTFTSKKSPPPAQQMSSPPLPHHAGPQHVPQPQHPHHQLHPPPPMMSPQQLSSLNHQPQQHPQMQHHPQQHPQQLIHGGAMHRPPQNIKPEQLHNPQAPGGYAAYYQQPHPQQQPPPRMHPQQHPGQQGMYPPQQHQQFMQHPQQQHPQQQQANPGYAPHPQQHPQQGYRPHPQQLSPPQQQWWSGA